MYRVDVSHAALRQLSRITDRDRGRILRAIHNLASEPRPPGAIKLSGKVHRIRIGQFRVIYSIYDKEQSVLITKVGRREKDTYRNV